MFERTDISFIIAAGPVVHRAGVFVRLSPSRCGSGRSEKEQLG
jgi:hypothetical protein